MAFKSILLSLIAPGALLAAAPALAQNSAPSADLPACSATVTDHCVQRGGSHHAMAAHHAGHRAGHHARHHGRHHAAARRHHKARHHRGAHHAASAPATPAKPKG